MSNIEPHHLAYHAKQFSEAIAALIEVQAMIAENMQRQHLGQSMAYNDVDFMKVADTYGLTYNSLIEKQREFF